MVYNALYNTITMKFIQRQHMDAIAYSNVRQHLAEVMDKICDEHEPIIITRKKNDAVIMMSLEDFNSIQETAYLLKNSANAERLHNSFRQYEEGKYQERTLIE